MKTRNFLILLLTALMATGATAISCNGSGDGDSGLSTDDDSADDAGDDDSEAAEIAVGFARTDISPDHPVIMGGYGVAFFDDILCRWSTGVHDPIYATAAAFVGRDGEPVILIHLDVIGVILPDTERIQAGVAEALSISPERILTAGSHSHGSPDTMGIWGVISPSQTGRDDAFIENMIDGAIEAAVRAYGARVPATLRVASGIENRMHFNPQMEFDPEATLDDAMTVLAAYSRQGRIIGTLMNWGCHPMVMGPQNKQITADYPGAYYRFMDEEAGGINMFVNSTLGGTVHPQNPEDPFEISGNRWGTWGDVDNFGRVLADDAKVLIAASKPLESYDVKLVAADMDVQVQNPFWISNDLVPREVPPWMGWAKTKVSAFSIGDVKFGTVPGELSPNLGLALRDIMGGNHQFLINVGMDWFGYLLTREHFFDIYYIYYSALCIGPGIEATLLNQYHAIFDGWPHKNSE